MTLELYILTGKDLHGMLSEKKKVQTYPMKVKFKIALCVCACARV